MTNDAMHGLISPEQIRYARILEAGVFLGLFVLVVTFALYVTGIVEPAVPVHDLPHYWGLSVHDYLDAINRDHLHREHLLTGWAWLSALRHGDYLNYVGIVMLAAVTAFCYLGIVPTLLRQRDAVYATIAVLEAVILILAASGIVAAGH